MQSSLPGKKQPCSLLSQGKTAMHSPLPGKNSQAVSSPKEETVSLLSQEKQQPCSLLSQVSKQSCCLLFQGTKRPHSLLPSARNSHTVFFPREETVMQSSPPGKKQPCSLLPQARKNHTVFSQMQEMQVMTCI